MSSSAVRMGRAFVEIGADPAKLFKALQQANARIGRFAAGMRSVGTRMMGAGTAMAAPIALASRSFATFDDAIRATAAVSGATGADLQALNDRARLLGETTSFTAVQVANLMTELGRAGFKTDEINAMTGAVLDLARATGTDATLASGIMAATLRQFALGAGDAARVADVLTTAANATFNTVEGLGESLKFAGPVAKSLGMSLEDTVAVLGVLGNVGIQGSEAGTALRRLSVIAAGSGEQLQKIFGVSNTDAAGQMKPLVQVLDEINTVTANMPVAERTAKMAEAFGLLGITSANVLSQTAGGVTELADKLRGAEGSAATTAKQMDAGLGGSARIALSSIEGLSISIGDALAPTLQSVIGSITEVVGGITKFVKANQETVVSVAKVVAAVVGAGVAFYGLGAAIGVVSSAIGLVLPIFGLIAKAVIGLAVSFGVLITKIFAFNIASVAAAAASAAAWTVANLALVGQIGFLVMIAAGLFKIVGGYEVLGAVLGGVRDGVNTVAESFAKLREIGVMALGEIMASIKDGDIAGAMQIAMKGLVAAFTVGSNAFLNAVDEWGVNLLNAFDFYISSIPFLRFLGPDQYQFSVFGDSTQGNNANTRADSRFAEMGTRQDARTAASNRTFSEFAATIGGRRSRRAAGSSQPAVAATPTALNQVAAPGSFLADIDSLGPIGASSQEVAQRIRDAAAARAGRDAELLEQQRAMQSAASSQAEVAGTFSAAAVGGMGFGSSLQQQMADYAKRTADATERMADEIALTATS